MNKLSKAFKFNTYSDIFVIVVLSLIVFIVCVWRVPDRFSPNLVGDEFSQLAIAAYFAGYDWSNVVKSISFYSWGYSLLLVPFFYIFDDSVTIYRATFVLNSALASLLILLSYLLCRQWGLSNFKQNKILGPIILFSTLVAPIIAYAFLSLSEVLLVVLFFATTNIFYKLMQLNVKSYWFAIQAILVMYMYTVHNRTIAIVVAAAIFMLFLFYNKKISLKNLSIFIICCVVIFIVNNQITDHLLYDLWMREDSSAVLGNTFEHRLPQFLRMFTVEGFLALLTGIVGQIFYLMIATFGLIFFAVHKLSIDVISILKKQENIDYVSFFILLAVLGNFAVSVIGMTGEADFNRLRMDHLIYGRYNLTVYTLPMLLALIGLANQKYKPSRRVIFTISIFCACLSFWIIKHISVYYIDRDLMIFNVIDLGFFRRIFPEITGSLFASVILALLVMVILTADDFKIYFKSVLLILLIIFNFQNSFVFYQYFGIRAFDHWGKSIHKLLENTDPELDIFFLIDNDLHEAEHVVSRNKAQIFLLERRLRFVYPHELPEHEFYIFPSTLQRMLELDRSFTSLGFINNVGLFHISEITETSESSMIFDLHGGSFDSRLISVSEGVFISQGTAGFLIFGPYVNIPAGNYTVKFELKLLNYDNYDLGFVDVRNHADEFAKFDLTPIHFTNGHGYIEAEVEFLENVGELETRVFVNEGTILEVVSIQISR